MVPSSGASLPAFWQRRFLALFGSAVATWAAIVMLAAPGSATAGEPQLRLLRTAAGVTAVRFDAGPATADGIPVFVAALNEPFELRVARGGLGQPIVVRQVVQGPAGPRLRTLPHFVVRTFASAGLEHFFRLTVTDSHGVLRLRRESSFCPASRQRVTPAAPEDLVYPDLGCGALPGGNPFILGQVWGIERGWAATALGPDASTFDLPDGTYRAQLTITGRYRRLFALPSKGSSVRFRLRVRTDKSDPCPPRLTAPPPPCPPVPPCPPGPPCPPCPPGPPGPPCPPLPLARAGRADTSERPPTAPQRPSRQPMIGSPSPSTLPDIAALPAWGFQTAADSGGHDQLQFSATVWNAGPAPLVVDGFRGSRQDRMDAYQNFYLGARRVGYRKVGSFQYDPRQGHEHWHFKDFASYSLLSAKGSQVVRSGKEAFCLGPTDPEDLTVMGAIWRLISIGFSDCGSRSSLSLREALPAGWGDTYVQSLPGQSFDITKVPNGVYLIEVHANPHGRLLETSSVNNVSLRRVTLGGAAGRRTVKAAPFRGING